MLRFLPLFLLCVGMGLIYILELLARRRQVEEMIRFLRYARRENRFQSRPIVDLLNCFESDLPLLSCMETEEPFDLVRSYELAKKSSLREMFFDSAEWRATDELFHVLGSGDGISQEESLRICEEAFCHASGVLREKVAHNGKPALVLGVSTGIVLVLLLI